MDTMIELPAMRRTAELAPNSVDNDARTVEVIWSAGARVHRASFFGKPHDEELSLDPAHVRLDRLNAGAPFLKVHELDTLDAVIGSVVLGSPQVSAPSIPFTTASSIAGTLPTPDQEHPR